MILKKSRLLIGLSYLFVAASSLQAAQPQSNPNYKNILLALGYTVGIGFVQKNEKAQQLLEKIGYGKEEASIALSANALAAGLAVINPDQYSPFVKWTPVATIVHKAMTSQAIYEGVNKAPFINVLAPDKAVAHGSNGNTTDSEKASHLGKSLLFLLGYQAVRQVLI